MSTRALSGAKLLTPLAVLVPILAIPVGSFWAITVFPPLALLVIAAGLAATAFTGSRTYGLRTSLIAAGLTFLAAVVALPVWYGLSINTSVCGKNVEAAWAWLPLTVGAVVFFALGSAGLRTGRAVAMVPMALLAGALATFLLYAAVPGTQGTCET